MILRILKKMFCNLILKNKTLVQNEHDPVHSKKSTSIPFFDSSPLFFHSFFCLFHLIIKFIVGFGIILMMASLFGFLRVRVIGGINLAIRDVRGGSSDPYVVIKMGKQKLKTSVCKKNLNPVWNEDLTLCVADPYHLINLEVHDYDRFGSDDKMGEAEFDIIPLVKAVKLPLEGLSSGNIVTVVTPSKNNCLAGESCVMYKDGYFVQDMRLRLQNVECGEVELQLQWVDLPGSKGF